MSQNENHAKPLFMGKEVSLVLSGLRAVATETSTLLTQLRLFSPTHTDVFMRGYKTRDTSIIKKLNFKVALCNLKVSMFMNSRNVKADRDEFKAKKDKAMNAEKDVKEKLARLEQEKDRAQDVVDRDAKVATLKRRMGREDKFSKLFGVLSKK